MFIGEHYHYSEKPVFQALWDNYNECQFVEDTGKASHALSGGAVDTERGHT